MTDLELEYKNQLLRLEKRIEEYNNQIVVPVITESQHLANWVLDNHIQIMIIKINAYCSVAKTKPENLDIVCENLAELN